MPPAPRPTPRPVGRPNVANDEVLEVFLPAEAIARRVAELAARLSADYAEKDLVVVGVLKGCFLFVADLVRQLSVPAAVDFLRVASYGAATESSGVVQFRMDVDIPIGGRDVLLVEDIVDTGLTLDYLRRHLGAAAPRSLKICALLDKRGRRRVPLQADYVGFEIDDHFVVGYGLDYDERFRELPDVCVLAKKAGHG